MGGCASSAGPGLRLSGVAAVQYDGLDLTVESAAQPDSPLFMLFRGVECAQAALRVGDSFTISDGARRADEYELLSATEQLVIFKQTTTLDRRAEREGVRRHSRVISVTPYGRPPAALGGAATE